MASEHGEEIIRKEHSKRVACKKRSGRRLFKDVRCNAFSFIIQLLFPSPAPSRNYSLHRYFHQSSCLGTTRKESIIARIITRRDLSNQSSKVISSKNSKNSGDFKIGRRLGIEKCWYKLFLFEEGCPLESARSFFQAGEPGPPKTGQGRYGEEGVARGGEGNGTAAVPFPESPSGACAPLAWRSSVRFAGGVHR